MADMHRGVLACARAFEGFVSRTPCGNYAMQTLLRLTVLALAALATGCGPGLSNHMTPERKDNGLVVILPGIEGPSPYNANIQEGLVESGLNWAITPYYWGRPVPVVGPLLNQMDVIGNRMAAGRVAEWIVEYQKSYPGRPVWLVGHSGGGGVAVFTAEAMPQGHRLTGLVLLSASLHEDYDLAKALANTTDGIVNFYNPDDSALLAVGTTLTSNVDGRRGRSAGLDGFTHSYPGLSQRMIRGGGDPHGAATRPSFVRSNVVPVLRRSSAVAGSR